MAIEKGITPSTRTPRASSKNLESLATVNVLSENVRTDAPPQLAAIYSLLAHPPAEIGFSSEQINEIREAKGLWGYLQMIDEGSYLDNFLLSLGWWVKVTMALLDPTSQPATASVQNLEEENVLSRLEVIMSLYLVAYKARYYVDAIGSDPTGLELVKRFDEFKQYVCRIVQRDFPEADILCLLKLA
jgi:hypothetical protein